MFEADVPADAYFCCALLRGIASSHLELEDKARLFRQIYQAVPVDSEQSNWLTLEIAAAQSDLSLFEQAAKSGAQLPWIPSVEQNGLAALLSGPDKDQQTIYDRFTVLCTILRHQIYRKHWQAGVKTYKALVELSTAPALQKEVPQQALHGCFIRLISALLAVRGMQQSLDVCRVTMQNLGADRVSSRVVSRIIMAASSFDVRELESHDAEEQQRPLHLVPALRFARQWAQARLQLSPLATSQVDVDDGQYTMKAIRSVIVREHLGRITLAALHKVPLYAGTKVPLEESLNPFKELLETLEVLDSQLSYRRWWVRLKQQIRGEEQKLVAWRRWQRALPLVRDMMQQADEQRAKRKGQSEDDWWRTIPEGVVEEDIAEAE